MLKKSSYVFILISTVLLIAAAIYADGKLRIAHGSQAAAAEFPHQVALFQQKKAFFLFGDYQLKSQFCGGSLISPNHILTAAHCVTDDNKKPTTVAEVAVIAGTNSIALPTTGTVRSATRFCVHPSWGTNGLVGDIAIIEVGEAFPLNGNNIQTAQRDQTTPATGTTLTASGWGLMESNTQPTELRKVDVPIVAGSYCGSGFDSTSMVCAGYLQSGADACSGDSGGPLQRKSGNDWIVSGVTSWGPAECGASRSAGAYAKVANYAQWINNTIAGLNTQCSAGSRSALSLAVVICVLFWAFF